MVRSRKPAKSDYAAKSFYILSLMIRKLVLLTLNWAAKLSNTEAKEETILCKTG
jgi:hypothetical protein